MSVVIALPSSDTPLFGLCAMYPAPGIIERIGPDWDWIWIDAQHGDLDYRDVSALVRACQLIGKPSLVRIPSHDVSWAGKVLDLGASGIIVPMIESLDEAKAMVTAAKFPPLGNRSYGGRRIIDLEGRDYYKKANADQLLILQVESNEAIDLSEQIAAMDGVDGVFLGPDDLLIRDGQDVNTPKDKNSIGRQSRAVAEVCRRHGKRSVCVSATPDSQRMAQEFGYQLVVATADAGLLAVGSANSAKQIRGVFAEQPASIPGAAGGGGALY